MKREFSAGGIVLNSNNQVLLVQNSSNHKWGFPKGLIDPGQTSKEAAIREVREEGGVVAEIVEKAGDTKYVYSWEGEKRFKVVNYYLMNYISGDPKDHDYEISEAGFFDLDEALKTLDYPADKKLLKQVSERILK